MPKTIDFLKKSLRFGEKFCIYPFIHFHLNTKKQRYLCCYSDFKSEPYTESGMADVRDLMLNNQPVGSCSSCYIKEQNNILSARQKAIKDFLPMANEVLTSIEQHEITRTVNPIWYDLRPSNLCNLECQMCEWTHSSSIAKSQGVDDSMLRWELDIEINPKSKRIYLAGGEPFLIKKYATMLNSVESSDCEIVVNTNATILTERLLLALDKFNNINFTLSIDGYGSLNEKIRKNSCWNTIVQNIKILDDRYGSKKTFHVNTVVQKDNINHLLELGEWINGIGITRWTLVELTKPAQFKYSNTTYNIPDELFKLNIINENFENVSLLKKIKNAEN